jgi:hypothetical protein
MSRIVTIILIYHRHKPTNNIIVSNCIIQGVGVHMSCIQKNSNVTKRATFWNVWQYVACTYSGQTRTFFCNAIWECMFWEGNFAFRDWRVVHAMSHHLYPNSLLDLDISMFAPLFQFLPDPSKTLWGRYGPWVYSPLVYSVMFHGHMLIRWYKLNPTEHITVASRHTSKCSSPIIRWFSHSIDVTLKVAFRYTLYDYTGGQHVMLLL